MSSTTPKGIMIDTDVLAELLGIPADDLRFNADGTVDLSSVSMETLESPNALTMPPINTELQEHMTTSRDTLATVSDYLDIVIGDLTADALELTHHESVERYRAVAHLGAARRDLAEALAAIKRMPTAAQDAYVVALRKVGVVVQ
ncbi:hypothetical protein SEA_UPYO_52 [Gordonia phage Upyo]|nr:hypothetical protein SEA_UPYO_52 [Gordonia phage Upyo]